MAGCSSWQTYEGRPDHAVIRRPGERPAAEDLREILLYMVGNMAEVNLLAYSKLNYLDDKLTYEEMANKAADPAFSQAEVDQIEMEAIQSALVEKIEQYTISSDNYNITDYISTYIYTFIVGPLLKAQPIKCIKRIYAVAGMFARIIGERQDLANYKKFDLCQHVVEAIYLAVDWFEKDEDSQPLECYVNIWEMDYTAHGGLQNLRPQVCKPLPVGQDIPGTGAELVKHMLSTMTGIAITKVYGVPQQQGNLCILKAIVVKLVDADWRANPVTADTTAERALLDIYNKTIEELQQDKDSCVTKEHRLHCMSLKMRVVLVSQVLSKYNLPGYKAWAAFFILISKVVKDIQQQPNAMVDEAVLTSFCNAMFLTMNTLRVKDIAQSDPNLWLNFESNYGHLLNQSFMFAS